CDRARGAGGGAVPAGVAGIRAGPGSRCARRDPGPSRRDPVNARRNGMTFPKFRLQRIGPVSVAFMLAMMPACAATATSGNATPEDLGELEGSIAIDGSSTVGPLTAAVAEEFLEVAPDVRITIDFSG